MLRLNLSLSSLSFCAVRLPDDEVAEADPNAMVPRDAVVVPLQPHANDPKLFTASEPACAPANVPLPAGLPALPSEARFEGVWFFFKKKRL